VHHAAFKHGIVMAFATKQGTFSQQAFGKWPRIAVPYAACIEIGVTDFATHIHCRMNHFFLRHPAVASQTIPVGLCQIAGKKNKGAKRLSDMAPPHSKRHP
jgi:hypothetical protein